MDRVAARTALRYWGDICPALLSYLQEQPIHAATTRDAYRAIAQRYEIPAEWRKSVESSGGESYFENRVRFAREYLCDHGLIHRHWHRGVWKLTPEGVTTKVDECPRPTESFRSRTGHTLEQWTKLLQRLSREHPEAHRRVAELLELDG